MQIQQIKDELASKQHPVARALHSGEHFKVLVIGFAAGMSLKEHKAHLPTKLTVLEGEVVYVQGEQRHTLKQYAEQEIPQEVLHSVEAMQDSLCLLTQG